MITRTQPKSRHSHHSHHSHRSMAEGSYGLKREKEMIQNRIVLIIITLTISYLFDASRGIQIGLIAHLVISLATALTYKFQPNPSNLRRFAGLCTDFGTTTYLFSVDGQTAALLYPLFLWVILGYGFRFGNRWLFIAAAMGSASFGWSIMHSPFWHEIQALAFSLLAGLMVVPGYCSTLITKLSQAKEEAEKANKSKTLFLASISHELRTPLNAIIGYGTHLLDMGMPEKQKQMVSTSVSAGRHLLHLINQLLSFAKSESLEELPKPQNFRPTDILTEVRDILQISADDKGLELNLQAEVMSDQQVSGQADYVKNILINLTSNAVKFTEEGSVSLKCGLQENGSEKSLWCSVSDTGAGIADSAKEKIFGVFQQADDTVSKTYGGTGLGLAICRQLAHQLGGEVTVESELGVGSVFTFSCPINWEVSQQENRKNAVSILSIAANEGTIKIPADESQQYSIRHLNVADSAGAETILDEEDLSAYDIALVSAELADTLEKKHPLWQRFTESRLPPVLISKNKTPHLDEIFLRASFASVLPASPNFDAIRSAVEIGCSFYRDGAEEDSKGYTVKEESQPRRVLVADDNRTNQMVLETILSNAGHEVTLVPDGEQALAKLENDIFDIVFLDVNMPVLGGIDCCKLWRQIEGARNHIPIIGLTADSTDETEKKCLDAGMDLRLTKPIEAGILLDTINIQTGDRDTKNQNSADIDPFGTVQSIDKSETANEPAPIDPAQLEYLLSIGDSAFVQSIVDAYIEDSSEVLKSFGDSVEQKNVEDFRFHAHAFKSGANNVGALKLSTICAKLEVITEAEFESRRLEYLDQITLEIERIIDYLNLGEFEHSDNSSNELSEAG